MNIVRLGMIVTLGVVAWYALSIYAAMPVGVVSVEPKSVQQTITYMCPSVDHNYSGIGSIVVAITALTGAITVAAVDLHRRVY